MPLYTAGTAVLQIIPSLRGVGPAVRSQLGTELRGLGELGGDQVGAQLGTQLGRGMNNGLSRYLPRLRSELEEIGDRGSASMSVLARGTAPVLDQLAKVSPILGRMRDGFESSTVASMGLSGVSGTLGGRLRTVVDATSRVGEGFVSMATTSETALNRVGGTVGRTLTAPIRGASSLLANYGITAGSALTLAGTAAVGMGIRFAASQEQAVVAFTTMLRSGEAAQGFMTELQAFAAKTPFDLPSVVSGAQRLMAFGFAAKDVVPTLTAIGDAVAGMGGSAEMVERVTVAIGQMSAKGKVQGDELLQLTEAGIPALRILANQYGVTTTAMQDMISKGLVASGEAIPKLLSGISQGTRGAAGETTAFAGMMANQATTLTGVWSNFSDNLNISLGRLVSPALPAIKTGLSGLTDALGMLPALIVRFQDASGPVLAIVVAAWRNLWSFLTGSILPALHNVWVAVQPIVLIVGGALVAALRVAGALLTDYIGPALVAVSSWLEPIMPVVVGIAAAFGAWLAIAGTVRLLATSIALVRSVILAVQIAWLALQIAFVTSPIGFVVAALAGLVAGVVYAWTHFEGFRTVVLAVWHAIQTAAVAAWQAIQAAISFAWNSVLKPAFAGIVVGLRAVGSFFSWLWVNIISPVAKAIYTAVAILAAVVLTVLVTPVVFALKLLGALFGWLWDIAIGPTFRAIGAAAIWLWQTILQPALAGIGAVVSWAWTTFIQPILSAIVAALQLVGGAAVWLWQNAIVPAWQAISTVVAFGYNSVLLPVLSALRTAVEVVGAAFGWVYANVIKPVWDALGVAVRAVYDHALHPAFEAIKTAVGAVGDAFGAVVRAIETVWNTIKAIVAAPINFVITTIWNNGIRAVWNKIVGWIPGLDLTLGELSPIKLAHGGVLPGYAPGRDTVRALLSPGEAVLVPEAVRMLGAENILALNAHARRGRGGPSSATAAGPTFAADGMPRFFLGGLWDGITSVAGGIAHVAEAVAGAVADAATFIAHFTTDPLGTLTSMIPGLDGLTQWASKGWGKAITQLPGSIFGGLISNIKESLGLEDDGKGGPASGGIASAQAFANQQRGKKYLWGATGPENWDCSGLVGALVAVSQGREPYRRYMTTAQMGPGKFGMTAGKGVFTVYLGPGHTAADLGGLHAEAYGGDGTELAIGRVGTPLSYYNQILHLFSGGGIVGMPRSRDERWESFAERGWPEPPARIFDTGGWLPPGLSTVYNGTRAPEAVLTPGQWDAMTTTAQRDRDGGEFRGQLFLDSGELLGVVRGEIRKADDQTGRAIARRTR